MIADWFNANYNDKLYSWKEFRDSISDYSVEEKIEKTCVFFSRIGYSKRSIDFYTPSTWPSAWELLDLKVHCLSTISLMMYYTLKFVGVDTTLMLIDDGEDEYLVPYHSDTDLVLNYYNGCSEKLSVIECIKIVRNINL